MEPGGPSIHVRSRAWAGETLSAGGRGEKTYGIAPVNLAPADPSMPSLEGLGLTHRTRRNTGDDSLASVPLV